MFKIRKFTNPAVLFFVIISMAFGIFGQEESKQAALQGKPIMWEAVNISQRDLYWGPGGKEMHPNLQNSKFIGRQPGGNNLKYRIKDGDGREWVVKIADESQPEVVAVRLLWAIGYKTEIDYIVPKLQITGIGNYKNARLEARPDNIKRLDRWSWTNNPFAGTDEFEGLKIMMALVNNWDLKDDNNAVLKNGDELHYIVSDLGSSFGKLAKQSSSRSGRSVNNPTHFAESNFIKSASNGVLEFDYTGKADHLIKSIKMEHGRWLADLLIQLSDKQIEDAFRAANYSPKDIKLFSQSLKQRIRDLDAATKSVIAAQTIK